MLVNFNTRSILLVGLFIFFPVQAQAQNSLKTFVSDRCTYFPEGTLEKPNLWGQCCFDHDLRYWFGGSEEDMLKADIRLKNCVTARAGSFYGNLMYYGVRAGHFSPVKNEYKWSWGWSVPRTNQPLNSQEKEVINSGLDNLNLDSAYIEAFKSFYSL